MSRLSETPTVHETATVVDCTLGRWTEVKARVSLREVAAERGVLGDAELAQALDSFAMTERLQA